jgi:hypothetical protein
MTASTRCHADRPLIFTVSIAETGHSVRARRIHPVGEVLDGGRSGPESAAGSTGDRNDFSWGHDVCDIPEGLMTEPPGIRRRQRLRSSRAACHQMAAVGEACIQEA